VLLRLHQEAKKEKLESCKDACMPLKDLDTAFVLHSPSILHALDINSKEESMLVAIQRTHAKQQIRKVLTLADTRCMALLMLTKCAAAPSHIAGQYCCSTNSHKQYYPGTRLSARNQFLCLDPQVIMTKPPAAQPAAYYLPLAQVKRNFSLASLLFFIFHHSNFAPCIILAGFMHLYALS
jgi:hypothetical protein